MSKQTAVEQFLNAIKDQIPLSKEHLEMIESYAKQAKEMEKQMTIDDYIAGMEFIAVDPNKYAEDAEQYYNETYNKEEK
jgi:hypothetical protein